MEIVGAFVWFYGADQVSEVGPDVVDASLLRLSRPVLDLGECLLDGIEVGRVFRQEPQLGAGGPDGLADGPGFVAAKVIHYYDVTWLQRRHKDLLDVGAEAVAIDRAVEDAWRGEPVAAQGAKEGQGAPASPWREATRPLAFRSPAARRRPVGPDPCLVDEDEPVRIEPALPGLPALAMAGDVRPALLKGEQRFF